MGKVDFQRREPQQPHRDGGGGSQVEGFSNGTLKLSRLAIQRGHGAERHQHPEEQLIYVLQGAVEVTLADETYQLGPGEASYHPPNVPHRLIATEDSVVLSFKPVP